MDPTDNVLLGWAGMTMAVVALLASMSLLSGERDRGTLAWSLTLPVSPTSVLAAKWLAAILALTVVTILAPLGVSVAVATVAYGSLPDLGTVGLFAAVYIAVPAFYVSLTLALSTVVKGTAGIAGIGLRRHVPSVRDRRPRAGDRRAQPDRDGCLGASGRDRATCLAADARRLPRLDGHRWPSAPS